MSQSVDVVVVGLGPGGEDVAGRLAEAGLDVVGMESTAGRRRVPVLGVRAVEDDDPGRRPAGRGAPDPRHGRTGRRRRPTGRRWRSGSGRRPPTLGRHGGGRPVRGQGRHVRARHRSPGRARPGRRSATRCSTARRGIVLATGTQAAVPPIDGLAGTPFWTNRQAIEAEQPPTSLIVLGGGAIGLELAQVFARFGADVTVVEAADRLLPLEEPEAGALLADVLTRRGHDRPHRGCGVDGPPRRRPASPSRVGGQELTAERLLVATGRRADLGSLGLESVGLDPSARWLDVDEHLRAAPRRVGGRRPHRPRRVHPRRDVPGADRRPVDPRRGPRPSPPTTTPCPG